MLGSRPAREAARRTARPERSGAVAAPAQSGGAARWRLLLFGLILVAGATLAVTEPVDRAEMLARGEALAESPWTALMLVALLVLMLALGLPGTAMVWLVAPFYAPPVATLLMLSGSVIGAAAAYLVADYLGQPLQRRLATHRTFTLLSERSDFFTQAALRALPGFPHAIVNYTAGLLRLPWAPFLLAAMLGLSMKWAVYCWTIHGLFQRGFGGEGPGVATLLPLVLLTVFLGLGGLLSRRLKARSESQA